MTFGKKEYNMANKGKYLAIWGLVLQLGFIVGIAGTIFWMLHAFALLPDTSAPHTPDALASNIANALHITAIGMAVSLVGDILLCIALFGTKYRAIWFKTAMWIMSVLWLLTSPIGIILGIVTMVYLSTHKHEFTEPAGPGYPPQGVGSPDP